MEEALREVRGLAGGALVGTFELVMSSRVTEVLEQQIVRPASKGRGTAKSKRSRSKR